MRYRLNPEWDDDAVQVEGVVVSKDGEPVSGEHFRKYTDPIFEGRPPLLIPVADGQGVPAKAAPAPEPKPEVKEEPKLAPEPEPEKDEEKPKKPVAKKPARRGRK